MRKINIIISLVLLNVFSIIAQSETKDTQEDYWRITDRNSIVWDLTKEKRLPHQENIEMSGKNVSAIIYYEIDKKRNLTISRDVIFPQLRTYNKTNEPDWRKYRAYFRRTFSDEIIPSINVGNKTIYPQKIDSIEIGGLLRFYFTPVEDILLVKTLYPSMENRFLIRKLK